MGERSFLKSWSLRASVSFFPLLFFAPFATFSTNSRGNTCYAGYGLDLQSQWRWQLSNALKWMATLTRAYQPLLFSAGVDRKNTSRVAFNTKKAFSLLLGETFDLRKPPLEYWGQNVFEQHSCQFDLHLVHVHITCTTHAVFTNNFPQTKFTSRTAVRGILTIPSVAPV